MHGETDVLLQAVNAAMSKTLLKIRGFSDSKVEKIKEAVKKCMVSLHEALPSAALTY
jgi:hypothetical protein